MAMYYRHSSRLTHCKCVVDQMAPRAQFRENMVLEVAAQTVGNCLLAAGIQEHLGLYPTKLLCMSPLALQEGFTSEIEWCTLS